MGIGNKFSTKRIFLADDSFKRRGVSQTPRHNVHNFSNTTKNKTTILQSPENYNCQTTQLRLTIRNNTNLRASTTTNRELNFSRDSRYRTIPTDRHKNVYAVRNPIDQINHQRVFMLPCHPTVSSK